MWSTFAIGSRVNGDMQKVDTTLPDASTATRLLESQRPGLLPALKRFVFSLLFVKPDLLLEKVHEKLLIVKEADARYTLTAAERKQLAQDLEMFVVNSEQILDGCTEASGAPAELSEQQQQEINILINRLKGLPENERDILFVSQTEQTTPTTTTSTSEQESDSFYDCVYEEESPNSNTPNLGTLFLIKKAYHTIAHFRELQQGLLAASLEGLKKTVTLDKIKELCGSTADPDQPDVTSLRKKHRQLQQEISRRSKLVAVRKEGPEETLDAKIERLKQLGEQRLMTQLLFRDRNDMKQVFRDVLGTAANTHNSNLDTDRATVFQASIETVFGMHYNSWQSRLYLWLCSAIAFPLIKSYFSHAVETAQESLQHCIDLSPEEKLDKIFHLLINPLSDYLEQIVEQKTPLPDTALPHRLAFYFTDTYIPSLPSVQLDIRMQKPLEELQKTVVGRIVPMLKTVLQWISFIPDSLIFLVDIFVYKEIIRGVLAYVALPHLLNPSWDSSKTRSPLQHVLNQVALEQLQQLNSTTHKSAPRAVKASLKQRQKLEETVIRVIRALSLQETRVSGNQPNELVEWLKKACAPTIAALILQALESSLEGDKLSPSLIKVLDNLSETLASSSPPPTDETMRQTEHKLLNALKMAADTGVEELAEVLLDPSKKIQEELTFKMGRLHEAAQAFAKASDWESGWNCFSLAVQNLATDLKETQIDLLIAFSNELLSEFEKGTQPLDKIIGKLKPLQQEIRRIAQTRDNLSLRLDFFKRSDLTIDSISQAISSLTSLSGQDEKDSALETAIRYFAGRVKNFSAAPDKQASAAAFTEEISNFTTALEAALRRCEQLLQTKEEEFAGQTTAIPNHIKQLMNWTSKLTPPPITSENVASFFQIIPSKLAPLAQPGVVNLITAYGTSAYLMASNPDHIRQMIQRVAAAFLTL